MHVSFSAHAWHTVHVHVILQEVCHSSWNYKPTNCNFKQMFGWSFPHCRGKPGWLDHVLSHLVQAIREKRLIAPSHWQRPPLSTHSPGCRGLREKLWSLISHNDYGPIRLCRPGHRVGYGNCTLLIMNEQNGKQLCTLAYVNMHNSCRCGRHKFKAWKLMYSLYTHIHLPLPSHTPY